MMVDANAIQEHISSTSVTHQQSIIVPVLLNKNINHSINIFQLHLNK